MIKALAHALGVHSWDIENEIHEEGRFIIRCKDCPRVEIIAYEPWALPAWAREEWYAGIREPSVSQVPYWHGALATPRFENETKSSESSQ